MAQGELNGDNENKNRKCLRTNFLKLPFLERQHPEEPHSWALLLHYDFPLKYLPPQQICDLFQVREMQAQCFGLYD